MGTHYRWLSLESYCYGWVVWAFTPSPVAECIYSGHLSSFRCESCFVKIKAHFFFCCPFLALLWKPLSLDCSFLPALTLTGQGRWMPQDLLKTRAGLMLRKAFCFGCFVLASLWSSLLKPSIPAGHSHTINSFFLLWVIIIIFSFIQQELRVLLHRGQCGHHGHQQPGHHAGPRVEGAVGGGQEHVGTSKWVEIRPIFRNTKRNGPFLFCWQVFLFHSEILKQKS